MPDAWRARQLPPLAGGVTKIYRASAAGGKPTETAAWEEKTVGETFIPAVAVPGKEDEVKLTSVGGNITAATATTTEWLTLDCTGYTKTLTLSGTAILKIEGTKLLLVSGMTLSLGSTCSIVMRAPTSSTAEITTGGKTMPEVELTAAGAGSTYKLLDAWTSSKNLLVAVKTTIETSGNTIEVNAFRWNATEGTLKTSTSKIILTGTGEVWKMGEPGGGSNLTTVEGTGTWEITNTGEAGKKYNGQGKTYGTLIVASDNVEIAGSNTFATLAINTRGKSVKGTLIEKSSTQTITTSFTTNATEAEKIKLKSTLAGKAWKIKKTSGTVEVTGIELQDSAAEGGATFRDIHGVNVSGNSGWGFSVSESVTAADTITISESVVVAGAFTRALADTVTISETATRAIANPRSTADTVTITESGSRANVNPRSVADTIAISESSTRAVANPRTIGDTASVSDAASATSARARSASDTITESDTATGAATKLRLTADTITISEEATRAAQAFARSVADTISESDAASATGARGRSVSDTIAVSDTAEGRATKLRLAADTVIVSDQAAHTAQGLPRSAADTIAVSDQATRTAAFSRATADAVTVNDQAAGSASKLRVLADTIAVSDATARSTAFSRTAADTVTLGDQVIGAAVSSRTTADTVTIGDLAQAAASSSRAVGDLIAIGDEANATVKRAALEIALFSYAFSSQTLGGYAASFPTLVGIA